MDRILIVEDETEIRQLFQDILAQANYPGLEHELVFCQVKLTGFLLIFQPFFQKLLGFLCGFIVFPLYDDDFIRGSPFVQTIGHRAVVAVRANAGQSFQICISGVYHLRQVHIGLDRGKQFSGRGQLPSFCATTGQKDSQQKQDI